MSAATTDDVVSREPGTYRIIMVDPTTAAQWMTQNRCNRTIRRALVAKYANDMTAGRWCLTGAPIQFAAEGRLLDGQHRLLAILQSGVTVPMYVVRGLPIEAQQYMDTGSKRTVSDQLGLTGYEDTTTVAAGARLALMWSTDRLGKQRESISDQEIRAFVEDNPDLIDAATLGRKVRRAGLNVTPRVLCAAIWGLIDAGHDVDRVMEFLLAAAENRTTGPGDPKNALLRRLSSGRANRERMDAADVLGLIIRTYNANYLGKAMMKVPVFSRGSAVNIPKVVAPYSDERIATITPVGSAPA